MPNNLRNNHVLLLGAGQMAVDYATVLKSINVKFDVVGRNQNSANSFYQKTNIKVFEGGINKWLESNSVDCYSSAVVAVNPEELSKVAILLLQRGIKRMLLEKPAGMNFDEISTVAKAAENQRAEVYVAYNRRFYSSVKKAREIIREDGGVKSFIFEFTEWTHVIQKLNKSRLVLDKWLLMNSSHVINMAFYLGGKPKKISCYTASELVWHPSASIFSGAGISETGALFSYFSNWNSPGRWGIEILTSKHRVIFRPLEKLHIQNIGSTEINSVEISNELDVNFKPGLYKLVIQFLQKEITSEFCTIFEHLDNTKIYYKISNYQ